ncbi:MAG: hypothetical protein ABL952_07080 [Pyrinomonadaceae bacterium]
MNAFEIITLLSSLATTVGVFFAWYQIRRTGDLHRIQFEDSLSREYRELIQKIPVKALLGKELSDQEFTDARPFLFHYLNLTNDQIFLRSKNRVSAETWNDWSTGIKVNMALPAVARMWSEVEIDSKNFLELRQLIKNGYEGDPQLWTSDPSEKLLPAKK